MAERKHLRRFDDLEPGDNVEADLGSTLVRGNFLKFEKRGDRYYMMLKRANRKVEPVETTDITNIRILPR